MEQHLWDKLHKFHSKCVKSYAGVPYYVSYGTVCDHLGILEIKTELLSFAKKRLLAILNFTPFGREIINNRTDPDTTSYKCSTNCLITNEEVGLLFHWSIVASYGTYFVYKNGLFIYKNGSHLLDKYNGERFFAVSAANATGGPIDLSSA